MMLTNQNPTFDYKREPSRDILCIDCKSFYSSVECVERGLNPLTTKLVVMSYPSDDPKERGSGLILASSPQAKKAYGISNVNRARDLPYPYPNDLHIVPPRMAVYMEKNREINNIYKEFADEKNHHVYSVDESFLDVTDSLKLFKCDTAYQLAKIIQTRVYEKTGIYTTVGIGDNPLLVKLALDNGAKQQRDMKAEWRYEDVANTVWKIKKLTDFWGIGKRMEERLHRLGINSVYNLAHADYYRLKERLGVNGTQLFAHAWGIDRTFLGEKYTPKSKSIGNSQVLDRDYTRPNEIELVIKEMADQVATRLRRENAKTGCVSLGIGFSLGYNDPQGKSGFHEQRNIDLTNSSKELADTLIALFRKNCQRQDVRNISVNCHKLTYTNALQLNLFEEPEKQLTNAKVDYLVDTIRKKYGFKSLVHASSKLEGGRAIARSSLVGGHAEGNSGIEDKENGNRVKQRGSDEVLDYIYDTENRLLAVKDNQGLLLAALYDGEDNRVFTASRAEEKTAYQLFKRQQKKGKDSSTNGKADNGRKSPKTSPNGDENSLFWYGFTENVIQGLSSLPETVGSLWMNVFDTISRAYHQKIAKDRANKEGIVVNPPSLGNRPGEGKVTYSSEVNEVLIPYTTREDKHNYYEVRNYVNDVNQENTQVLQTYDDEKKPRETYTYGNERLGYKNEQTKDEYQYLTDARGSVTGLMQEGDLASTNHYSVFGLPEEQDDTGNPYGYTGEAPDVTGDNYLRARYYDSQSGTFLTQDSDEGEEDNPLSQNGYTYVENNPINYTDPTGHRKNIFQRGWGWAKKKARSAWRSTKRFVRNTYNSAKRFVGNVYNNTKRFVSNAWNGTKRFVSNTYHRAQQFFSGGGSRHYSRGGYGSYGPPYQSYRPNYGGGGYYQPVAGGRPK